MKKLFFMLTLLTLGIACSKVSNDIVPQSVEIDVYAKEYYRNVVFDGKAKVIQSDTSTLVQAKDYSLEMNFSKNGHLDKYFIGKYIDPEGKVYTTKMWFDAPNTSNTKIGEWKGSEFWFCAMDAQGTPICISGFIGKRIQN